LQKEKAAVMLLPLVLQVRFSAVEWADTAVAEVLVAVSVVLAAEASVVADLVEVGNKSKR
jgi:hypothetical protein